MARTVFDSRTVYHHWANGIGDSARNGQGNVSFSGTSAYSYSARIARLEKNRAGETAAVFTGRGYSVTTAKHVSYARSAARHLAALTVLGEVGDKPTDERKTFAAAIKELIRTAAEKTHPSARKAAVRRLADLIDSANAYCSFFGLKRFEMPTDLAAARAAIVKAEKAAAKLFAAERAAALAKRKEKAAADLERWKAGETDVYIAADVADLFGTDFTRVRDAADGPYIETTRGARVSAKLVNRAARFILPRVNAGAEWHTNGEKCNVGEYNLDSIDSDGTVRIGCHTFNRAEVLRIASLIGAD